MFTRSLHSREEIPIRGLHGAALRRALGRAILHKPARHGELSAQVRSEAARDMNQIGVGQALQHRLAGQVGLRPEGGRPTDGHQLDKAHLHRLPRRQGGQRRDFVVVEAADRRRG